MLKFVIAAAVCCGSVFSCFSLDVPKRVDLFGADVPPSALYAGCGHMHLLLKDFEMALTDLQRGSACIEQFEGAAPITEIVILFGKAVACDNLNLREECDRSLSQLILNIGRLEELDDDDDEDFYDDDDDDEELDEEDKEYLHNFIDTVRNIALLAPSEDVREVLLSLVDSINDNFEL